MTAADAFLATNTLSINSLTIPLFLDSFSVLSGSLPVPTVVALFWEFSTNVLLVDP
ncbi:MAG TPA: hypothetical protein VD815_09645 [Candidatus Saccharimonadales bacterium]|nr:hypothetical protein [Candidatus Saccharimonadales bacterium]